MDRKFFNLAIICQDNEATIEKCINSILRQAYSDFNITIFDLYSLDKTYEICEKLQKEHPDKIFLKKTSELKLADEFQTIKDKSDYTLVVPAYYMLYDISALRQFSNFLRYESYPKHASFHYTDDNCKILSCEQLSMKYPKLITKTADFDIKADESTFSDIKRMKYVAYRLDVSLKKLIADKKAEKAKKIKGTIDFIKNEAKTKQDTAYNIVSYKNLITANNIYQTKLPSIIDTKNIYITKSTKIACYTCITNSYDNLLEINGYNNNIDYICFSDNVFNKTKWKILPIPADLKKYSTVIQQRLIKILPHKYLPNYDITIWVDGNIQIKHDIMPLLKSIQFYKNDIFVRRHPKRWNVYNEAAECILLKKDSKEKINKQINKYINEKYQNDGLAETNILIRHNRNSTCKKLCDIWSKELLNHSFRDQLSFNYAAFKANAKIEYLEILNCIINDSNWWFNSNMLHNNTKNIQQKQLPEKKYSTNYLTIAICNFNTTELTNTCIKSIYEKLKNINFYIIVLDNSNKTKFILDKELQQKKNIQILDNTNKQYIDFDNTVNTFGKIKILANFNGSLKHAYSIQFLLNICNTEYMLLLDSDVKLINELDFLNYDISKYVTISDIQLHGKIDKKKPNIIYTSHSRFLPYIQLFNVKMINDLHITYFDPMKMHGGLALTGNYYDTGASFYEYIYANKLNYKIINAKDYILHKEGGSWK